MVIVSYFMTSDAYKRWEKEYDAAFKAGGAAPSSETTPLVNGDVEAQKNL